MGWIGWIIGKEGTQQNRGVLPRTCLKLPAHLETKQGHQNLYLRERALLTAKLGFKNCCVDGCRIRHKACMYQTVTWTHSFNECLYLPEALSTLSSCTNVSVSFCPEKSQELQRRRVYFLNGLCYTRQKATHCATWSRQMLRCTA